MNNESNNINAYEKDPFNDPFPTRLRELMAEHKVTQQELADLLALGSRQTVSQYRDGKTKPPIDKLIKIANRFNVSTDYILGLTESKLTDIGDRGIQERLGLSDKAIEILSKNNYGKHGKGLFRKLLNYKDWEFPPIIESLNMIIEEMNSPDSFLNLFTDYRNYKPDYNKKRFYTLYQDSGKITKTDDIDGMINIDPNLISFNADIIDNMFLMAIQDRLKEIKKNN